MKIIANLPPRDIEGADQVLSGLVIECASGNHCRVWPAMTYDADADQTRIAFFTEWRQPSTLEDMAELMAFTDGLMGKPPAVVTEGPDPCTDQQNVNWLRIGQKPKGGSRCLN